MTLRLGLTNRPGIGPRSGDVAPISKTPLSIKRSHPAALRCTRSAEVWDTHSCRGGFQHACVLQVGVYSRPARMKASGRTLAEERHHMKWGRTSVRETPRDRVAGAQSQAPRPSASPGVAAISGTKGTASEASGDSSRLAAAPQRAAGHDSKALAASPLRNSTPCGTRRPAPVAACPSPESPRLVLAA